MKSILRASSILLVIALAFDAVTALASCRNDAATCVNATVTAGEGCKIPVPNDLASPDPDTNDNSACFVQAYSAANAATICRRVINSNGSQVFVPTKTGAEWDAFIAAPPTGVTVDNGGVGGCWP